MKILRLFDIDTEYLYLEFNMHMLNILSVYLIIFIISSEEMKFKP